MGFQEHTKVAHLDKAALSKNAVGNIERGEFDVSVATLKRVAGALGRTGAELLAAAGI